VLLAGTTDFGFESAFIALAGWGVKEEISVIIGRFAAHFMCAIHLDKEGCQTFQTYNQRRRHPPSDESAGPLASIPSPPQNDSDDSLPLSPLKEDEWSDALECCS
jgi:hypothetical protein